MTMSKNVKTANFLHFFVDNVFWLNFYAYFSTVSPSIKFCIFEKTLTEVF
jgi:hypothetical protein